MKKKLILSKIASSTHEVVDAEKHLRKVLRDVRVAPRAECSRTARDNVEERRFSSAQSLHNDAGFSLGGSVRPRSLLALPSRTFHCLGKLRNKPSPAQMRSVDRAERHCDIRLDPHHLVRTVCA